MSSLISVWLSEWEWALESKSTTLDFEWQTIRFSALLTGTVQVETSLLMKWSCVVLTDGDDWPCNALLVSWVNSLLTDGMEIPCDTTGPTEPVLCGTFHKIIFMNSLEVQNTQQHPPPPPLFSFWRKNAQNIISQNVLSGKFQQLNVTGTKWPWASTITHWMNTPINCQENHKNATLNSPTLTYRFQNTQTSSWIRLHDQYQTLRNLSTLYKGFTRIASSLVCRGLLGTLLGDSSWKTQEACFHFRHLEGLTGEAPLVSGHWGPTSSLGGYVLSQHA